MESPWPAEGTWAWSSECDRFGEVCRVRHEGVAA